MATLPCELLTLCSCDQLITVGLKATVLALFLTALTLTQAAAAGNGSRNQR
jgi:hypothetical protein